MSHGADCYMDVASPSASAADSLNTANMVVFREPNFSMASATASTLVSGREKSPITSRRQSVARAGRKKSQVEVTKSYMDRKMSESPAIVRRSEGFFTGRVKIFSIAAFIIVLAVLAGTLAIYFARRPSSKVTIIDSKVWRPRNGTTWQIELSNALNDTSNDAQVYDIDLYSNSPETITKLHNLDRKVICYFSAGTYDESGPDHQLFRAEDYGNVVSDVDTEKWLDTRSLNVRAIMLARLDMAVHKGCDGIDPDHTNSYNHNSGFKLNKVTALDYVRFLTDAAHSRNLAIGLRNSGALVDDVVKDMEWALDQGCETHWNCALYQPFIQASKPVFHFVFRHGDDVTSDSKRDYFCLGANTDGFSTIVKDTVLDNWVSRC